MRKILITIVALLGFNTFVAAQIDSAFVVISTSAESGFLIIDDNYNSCIEFENGDKIKLKSGYQTAKVLSDGYNDISIRLNLEPNEEKSFDFAPKFLSSFSARKKYSTYYKCFWDANVIVLSDDDAETYLNGSLLKNPSVRLDLEPGETFEVKSTLYSASYKQSFETSNELIVIKNYLRPLEQDVLRRSFIPGYAQITKHQPTKGYLIIGLISTFAVSSVYSQTKVSNSENEFRRLEDNYETSTDPNEILEIISASNKELDTIDTFKSVRNVSITALLATYIYNVIDGRREPKFGFRYFSFDPYVEFDKSLLPKANIKIDF